MALQKKRRTALYYWLGIGAFLVFALFPVYWMVVSSIKAGGRFVEPSLIPTEISLDSLFSAFAKRPIARWYANTIFISLATAVLSLAISINAGYALARFRSKLNQGFGLFILFTQMLPAALIVIPMFVIVRQLGLLDSIFGLVLANTAFALPLSIWLMRGFFKSIPDSLEEAAQVDGSTRLGAFYRVTLPLAKPALVVVAVFAFLMAWNDFFFARALIFSDENWVLSIGLTSFEDEYTVEWSELMGAAVMFTLPAAVFFALVQKHLVSGLTGGAVKN
ncbi:MAG: carbohydrate ABC transporter permease [Actinomycetota bacterium]